MGLIHRAVTERHRQPVSRLLVTRHLVATMLTGLVCLLGTPVHAVEKVTVTTTTWPPYAGTKLPKTGATSEVVRQAFAAIETEIAVQVLPWKRAISTAKNSESAIAYFPGYHCNHVDGFVASEPIGTGPLGFAEHQDAPLKWQSIDDLGEQKLKIGTVLGYANTAEFDEKVGSGWIRAISAKDDATNLRKLLRRRVDAVVIDKSTLAYLLATDPTLKAGQKVLRFNEKPLETKTLYLCFTDNDAGRAMLQRFNSGLSKIDVERIVSDYFKNEF